ncbi:MAG TPA: STAS domain-containing protein [Spirochaetia bacterium]|nr:STAS domain-containing protein [Spirochaetia bacterium]
MKKNDLTPKLFSLLREGIAPRQAFRDLIAGLIVGVVALPLAIAFAIASGVSPEKGIITAIVAGLAVSAFGGSRVQIGGPTGAFVVIVVGIIQRHGVEGLIVATFMAGLMLILMGLFRLGDLLKFIPHTLITGFTTGIAVIIFTTQVKDFLGLATGPVPQDFFGKWESYLHALPTLNPWAAAVGLGTIAVIVALRKINPKLPGALIALALAASAVRLLGIPVETISSRFGEINGAFPFPSFTIPGWETLSSLFIPALTIALLGALESLLSASVADGMIGGNHRSNAELVAQGAGNILSALFGGLPATGAIARTATNVKSGGRTPLAGIVHALVLAAILLAAGPVAGMIPLAALAGILFVVAWNMSELKAFIGIFRINRFEVAVLLTTFLLTVFFDLTIAVIAGFMLSVLLFMKRMSDATQIAPLMSVRRNEEVLFNREIGEYPDRVAIFEVNGPLFFGFVREYLETARLKEEKKSVLILRLRYVPVIDATGLQRLKNAAERLKGMGIHFIISGADEQVKETLVSHKIIPETHVYQGIKEALAQARTFL